MRDAESPRHDQVDDEPEGGDPPGGAHLYADRLAPAGATSHGPVDLAAMAREAVARGPVWTHESADLDVNLLVFAGGEGVVAHVNAEVDVLLVGVAGEGVVEIDGESSPLHAGDAILIPKGARRRTGAVSETFAYLTCHRRRGALWPRLVQGRAPARGHD